MNKVTFAIIMALNMTTASAATITFDDLNAGTGLFINNGYAGFNWDNFIALDAPGYYFTNGYLNGMVSANNVALNGSSNPASLSSDTQFTLDSMYVTKAWQPGITHFDGYSGTTLLYSRDVNSTTTAPTFVSFNWTGLTKVVISDGNGSLQSVVDNITVSAVPVPAAAWLLGSGLLGFVGVARRRKIA